MTTLVAAQLIMKRCSSAVNYEVGLKIDQAPEERHIISFDGLMFILAPAGRYVLSSSTAELTSPNA